MKPVKILKDATARLLSVKNAGCLSDEQREMAKSFWEACSKPLLWKAFRNWEDSADEFRDGYISSHGVFLNALGLVGQCLLAQYGHVAKLSDLSSLNIRRDSAEFVGRCIDEVTGNMISNATAIKLTAIKMLCHVGCPVSPELQALERSANGDESLNDVFDDVGQERCVHLYADMVREKWPEQSEEQVENLCCQYEHVVMGFGETLESAKATIQCVINRAKKPSTVLNTIRANYKKVVQEQ